MSLPKLFLTAGAVWAPPLTLAAALATLHIFLWADRFTPGFESLGLVGVVLAALMAFTGSIVAGDSYGERLARKRPWPRAAKFGALLIVLGVLANVVLALGMLSLALPQHDRINFDFIAEELARESTGE